MAELVPQPSSSWASGVDGPLFGSTLGPASAALERELKTEIKQKGLVFWLDADGSYTEFVTILMNRAAHGEFPYPVVRFDGSFLELMLALEKHGNDLYPDKVLVHMPGFTEQTIAETPVYELYKAGKRHRKALDTLIAEAATGVVRPSDIQAFLTDGKATLASADVWLSRSKRGGEDVFLIALEARSAESVIVELFAKDSKLSCDLTIDKHLPKFLAYLHRTLGLDVSLWTTLLFGPDKSAPGLEELRYVVASWLMAVEFVTDLREAPVTPELEAVHLLQKPLVEICRALVQTLRDQFSADYKNLSLEFEERLRDERTSHQPETLGSIDTFRFEEAAVREAALAGLVAEQWEVAGGYARERHPEACFWVKQDKSRDRTWQLIQQAADAGRELGEERQGLQGCASLEEAVNRYRDKLYRVDRAHRHFEQSFHRLHTTELEDEAPLRRVREVVRERYRVWADNLCAEFAQLCEELGPLPSADLRQRAVYEQFVHPLIEAGKRVAFFLVDAMRFEMAEELRQVFESRKFKAQLHARLAELPTITEVGMNALAPVSQQGRLRPVIRNRSFCGFRTGEKFTVDDAATRVRAMASRSVGGNAIDLELAFVTGASLDELKNKLRTKHNSPLIVVRSLELDSAGEKGFHLGTFEHTLVQLREAVQRLRQAGIEHFVLAADHGYLLQDQTTRQIEYKDGPKRRHVLTPQRAGRQRRVP